VNRDRRTSSAALRLERTCPVPACVAGIVWDDDGPIGECPICSGSGKVPLSVWVRFTFEQAKK
jgi:hypothetical protein